mmetsp:Transcript_108835/g.318430  ORF Transcript_108835/g.318430 Transcript_108835/m.318430 type:complete len:234 (+) Transcript_108835:3618-4319(+)
MSVEEHKVPLLGLVLLHHLDTAFADDGRLVRLGSVLVIRLGLLVDALVLGAGKGNSHFPLQRQGPGVQPALALLPGARLELGEARVLQQQPEALLQILHGLHLLQRDGSARILALSDVRLLLVVAKPVYEEDVVPPADSAAVLHVQRSLAEDGRALPRLLRVVRSLGGLLGVFLCLVDLLLSLGFLCLNSLVCLAAGLRLIELPRFQVAPEQPVCEVLKLHHKAAREPLLRPL